MSILAERLTHIYNPGTPTERVALREVSLRIEDGACVAIVGVTGSGKSTLVQHFNGLLRPTSGRLTVDGVDVGARETKGNDLRALRQRVGLLFQFPEAQLFAPTIYADVSFGPRQLGLTDREVRERVRWALSAVALSNDTALWERSPFALSGGQRRRVALAGALAMRPRTLILDEPSAGLDAEARDELYGRLAELRASEGMTLILVSHDMGEVAALAETVFVLAQGELRLAGSPADLFQRTEGIVASGLLPPPLAQVVSLAQAGGYTLAPARLTPQAVAESIAKERQRQRFPPLEAPDAQ
jgi:energy-coupling factor transport system ATP-binding protein